MASFFTDLWTSIFTPGPTPTLVIATNVSFAALQLVLLLLLIATYNVHFFALSFLSAGLWASINWFVRELSAAQAEQEAAKTREEQDKGGVTPDNDKDKDSEAETVVDSGVVGSKEVEIREVHGNLKARATSSAGEKSETSTEDEWEKVSEENETEKDK